MLSNLFNRKIQNIDQITDSYNTFILPQILSSDCLGVSLCGWIDFEDYLKKPDDYSNTINLPLDKLSSFLKIEREINDNIIKLIFDIAIVRTDIRLYAPNFYKLFEILNINNKNNNTKIQIHIKNPFNDKLFWIEGDFNNKNPHTSTLKNIDLITGDNENNKVEIRNYKRIEDCNIGKNVVFNWFSLEYYSLPKIMKKHNYNILDSMKDVITFIKRKVNSKTVKFLDNSSGILIWYNRSFNQEIIKAFDKLSKTDKDQLKEMGKSNGHFNIFIYK